MIIYFVHKNTPKTLDEAIEPLKSKYFMDKTITISTIINFLVIFIYKTIIKLICQEEYTINKTFTPYSKTRKIYISSSIYI